MPIDIDSSRKGASSLDLMRLFRLAETKNVSLSIEDYDFLVKYIWFRSIKGNGEVPEELTEKILLEYPEIATLLINLTFQNQ